VLENSGGPTTQADERSAVERVRQLLNVSASSTQGGEMPEPDAEARPVKPSGAKVCRSCAEQNSAGARFCKKCGSELE
jgi:ribosomal protein L40E